MIDTGEFAQWVSAVLAPGYRPQHTYRPVGHLPDFVLTDPAVTALHPNGSMIHISDMQLLHACRNTKAARGAALALTVVSDLPQRLAQARWVWFSQKTKTHGFTVR